MRMCAVIMLAPLPFVELSWYIVAFDYYANESLIADRECCFSASVAILLGFVDRDGWCCSLITMICCAVLLSARESPVQAHKFMSSKSIIFRRF